MKIHAIYLGDLLLRELLIFNYSLEEESFIMEVDPEIKYSEDEVLEDSCFVLYYTELWENEDGEKMLSPDFLEKEDFLSYKESLRASEKGVYE